MKRTVEVVTLGCARNEVDSEELAGRLAADGWTLVDDVESAEVALVNTCGFIESAKKDSVDALLEANSLKGHGTTRAVVAVGCMAERYGNELAEALPEADAILGFDDYKDISARLQSIVAGESHKAHVPRDRRALLPIAPAERADARQEEEFSRKRLGNAPWAPLKIASGCDRRCSFCAIPYFRGSFISRRPTEIIAEARWLADNGVSEMFLVSENTTSYGKDLGDLQLMEKILPEIAALPGVERVRLSYLQPAEMRPTLLQAMIATDKTAPYFDLSFQHTSPTVLRRMRRFGDTEKFLHLISQIRALSPEAGIRSNFIVVRAQVLYYIAENLSARADEFTARLRAMGQGVKEAKAEVAASLARIFWYAAQADKYDGRVHATKSRHVTLAMNEPWGVMGLVCPDEMPLLGFVSLVIPAIAMGNRVVAVPSPHQPLAATDLYQVFDTSDVPGGVINIVTGERDELAKTLAEHDEVAAMWYFGSNAKMVETASAGNLKATWTAKRRDWLSREQGQGAEYLRRAVQVKNIWVPYGE